VARGKLQEVLAPSLVGAIGSWNWRGGANSASSSRGQEHGSGADLVMVTMAMAASPPASPAPRGTAITWLTDDREDFCGYEDFCRLWPAKVFATRKLFGYSRPSAATGPPPAVPILSLPSVIDGPERAALGHSITECSQSLKVSYAIFTEISFGQPGYGARIMALSC
jgi:hypothetical protein